jgi:hypothetical protein
VDAAFRDQTINRQAVSQIRMIFINRRRNYARVSGRVKPILVSIGVV